MNDRELLELAAKAADYKEFDVLDNHEFWSVILDESPLGNRFIHWNPLTDDGDAIRLAVSLELDLNLGQLGTLVYMKRGVKNIEELSEDCMAAFRRAIVRAAAAIGAAMNSEGN
jgi:hypothetical protein